MKTKVGAIRIAYISIFLSGIVYLECQWDFLICYEILQFIKLCARGLMILVHLNGTSFYNLCKTFYLWLLAQPSSSVFTKVVEMISSGVFGSALVTAIIYLVEYRIQNKMNIQELIDLQKKHIKKLNELTYISFFADDENDIQKKAYLEYAENSWKLRNFEEHEERIKSRKGMSRKDKKKEIQRRVPQYEFECSEKFKEWFWNKTEEKERREIIAEGYKEQFLNGALQDLLARTDLELAAAFYDYREIYEIDISKIQYFVDEICFMGLRSKLCKKKKEIINDAIRLDKYYVSKISFVLADSFEIEDFFKYFRGNKKNLLGEIDTLQQFFFEAGFTQSNPAKKYLEWEQKVYKDVLNKDVYDESFFASPHNSFEAMANGYALSVDFLKKVRIQNWDYRKYILPDFSKMKY